MRDDRIDEMVDYMDSDFKDFDIENKMYNKQFIKINGLIHQITDVTFNMNNDVTNVRLERVSR
jgi:hypothetical protein